MKKKSLLSLVLTGALAVSLIGCGGNSSSSADDKTIKIGVSPVPHKEIVEQAVEELKGKGYTVEIIDFDDYVLPNTSLEEGELDANYFQTIAYLEEFNENNKTHLTYIAEIHLEPMGAFSKKYKSAEEVEDGATVAIPDDRSNTSRALRVLEAAGLIEFPEGLETATVADISSNPKNLQFSELKAATLPRVLEEVDIAVINGNYALEADLDVSKDAFYAEDKDVESLKGRRNVLAVKEGSEESQKIKDLTEALTSDKIKDFINEKYKGAVVPVF